MPAFSFEKISPPASRGPIAPIVVKKRGVIVQILDRFVEARVKRQQGKGVIFRAERKKKV
jgi:hypothetical protein